MKGVKFTVLEFLTAQNVSIKDAKSLAEIFVTLFLVDLQVKCAASISYK